MTTREKYQNDPQYHLLVNWMVSHIQLCKFTPSELREAAVLASIIYEEFRIHSMQIFTPEIEVLLNNLHKKIDDEEVNL